MDSLTLKDLVASLDVDPTRFSSVVARIASPSWPATRVEPDVSVGVIAAGDALCGVLKPLIQAPGAATVVKLDWGGAGNELVVLRIVQGLTRGWRSYPAMPGLGRELSEAAPQSTGTSEDHNDTTQVSSSG